MPIQTRFSNIQALVIDDMAVQQTTLRGQLSQLGIAKIDVASNAEDAARLIKSRRYGLILPRRKLRHRVLCKVCATQIA